MKTELSAGGRSVQVDHERCSGTGYCRDAMPGLFELDEKRVWLREDFDLAQADAEDLEDVAAGCPWFAITVEDA